MRTAGRFPGRTIIKASEEFRQGKGEWLCYGLSCIPGGIGEGSIEAIEAEVQSHSEVLREAYDGFEELGQFRFRPGMGF